MSMGCSEKLSYRKDVGTVGMPEIMDPPEDLERKIRSLAVLISRSTYLVAFTGAGISTSSGIPDFRGPKGVWTLQKEGKDLPKASVPIHRALPSMTHMSSVALKKAGFLRHVISQNVDSLHLRSGIQREKLSELHGNLFREDCPSCGAEYLRDFEVGTTGMKFTSRRCSNANCGSKLKDTIVDLEEPLPQKEITEAEKHCLKADIILCLGTSLQIAPACDLPFRALHGGGRIVIVNLQETPKDKKATLVIHGMVDKVIARVMDLLDVKIPPFIQVDRFKIRVTHCPKISEQKYIKWTLTVTNIYGSRAPFPFVQSIEVSFPERSDLKSAILDKQPFKLKRETLRTNPLLISLKVNFGDGCKCRWTNATFRVHFEEVDDDLCCNQDAVIENLRKSTIQDQCCGQTSMIERKKSAKEKTFVYATTTNIVEYYSSDDAAAAANAGPSQHILKCENFLLRWDGSMARNKASTSSRAKKLKAS